MTQVPVLQRDFPAGQPLCVGIDFAWWEAALASGPSRHAYLRPDPQMEAMGTAAHIWGRWEFNPPNGILTALLGRLIGCK